MNPRDLIREALKQLGNTNLTQGLPLAAQQILPPITPAMLLNNAQNNIQRTGDLYESMGKPVQTPEEMRQTALLGANIVNSIDTAGAKAVNPLVTATADEMANKVAQQVPKFGGLADLSTKVIERMKGMREVSPETITNLSKSPDVKQAERDLLTKILAGREGKIPVQQFAEDVQKELLPLNIQRDTPGRVRNGAFYPENTRYESVNLPPELRGNVAGYDERIYQSPIKTSAGQVHFGDTTDNYFGHTRTEDVARGGSPVNEADMMNMSGDDLKNYYAKQDEAGDTRRVIELQSDLFQKGRLEGEMNHGRPSNPILEDTYGELRRRKQMIESAEDPEQYAGELKSINDTMKSMEDEVKPVKDAWATRRGAEMDKLKPYENTWHERLIREEVKKAAQDGKTKLQFPVGDTAMKIEGLGQPENPFMVVKSQEDGVSRYGGSLKPEDIQVGMHVQNNNGDWLITEIGHNGQFKAIPRDDLQIDNDYDIYKHAQDKGYYKKVNDYGDHKLDINAAYNDPEIVRMLQKNGYEEGFDLREGEKALQSNPIHKFYESEVGKYLKNKYGAQRITDPQGVEWWEVPIKPEHGKAPVEAYGIAGALGTLQQKNNKKQDDKETMRSATKQLR